MSLSGSRNGENPLYPGRLEDGVMYDDALVRVGYKGLPARRKAGMSGLTRSYFLKKSYQSLEIRDIPEGFDRVVSFLVAVIRINPCEEPLAGFKINSINGTRHHRPVGTSGVE